MWWDGDETGVDPTRAINDNTVFAGQLKVELPASHESVCSAPGSRYEFTEDGRIWKVGGKTGNIVSYKQEAVVESVSGQGVWLQLGTQR
jgi:hypothetical protein